MKINTTAHDLHEFTKVNKAGERIMAEGGNRKLNTKSG